jgi:hypothetical protein
MRATRITHLIILDLTALMITPEELVWAQRLEEKSFASAGIESWSSRL